MNCIDTYSSPLGKIYLKAESDALAGLCFEEQFSEHTDQIVNKTSKVITSAKKWLDKYFDNKIPKISELSLKIHSTPFREIVWKELIKIPYGKTITYGKIAQNIAYKTGMEKMSAQAVGSAIGKNPLLIIIPCHRVIGVNNLGGYSAGMEKKIQLLKIEKIL